MIKFASKYAFFAAIATGVNLFTQYVAGQALYAIILDKTKSLTNVIGFQFKTETIEFIIALGAGTITGLLIKYILDKKYIFYHETKDLKDDARKFIFYTFMGAFTTIIFWGTETLFKYMFKPEYAKYIGGAIGLTIGYITKYQLDKKFVFVNKD